MALLINMLLGELVFGGLGTGIYSMLMVAVVAIFLTGLMVGRTPEYLGKKIGPLETKMVLLYTLAAPVVILPLTAIAISTKFGLAGLTTNSGPHGFTEILFGYTSSFANNGQNFAGLNANTVFYNLTTAIAMLFGRFALAAPALGLASLLAKQKNTPISIGTMRTDSLTFGIALAATILIVAGLSYFPALTLGPILEHRLLR
jgi:K+-transporting ATPase ATPase A chain